MDKVYNSKQFEEDIYKKWEESGFFNPDHPDYSKRDPYSIMMPPPNVTGVLHLGHALENSLMDIMTRFQRMNGKKVLLLPGTDHAAVATQAKVEKILVEQGIKNPRQEFGREKLLEKIREYAENSKSTILKQIRKMGTSCDWSRLAYTFDEARGRAVNEAFVKMYNDGLIYRGYRVVNWSVKGQSTASDDELVHVERPAKLYYFKYTKDFPVTIATTRPETKLGDTAVAVNPKDKRYKSLIGKTFEIENFGNGVNLKIKIIADENVEMEFGTGALGVTPAHSAVDFEMYEKQKAKEDPIGLIPVIGEDGRMTENAGKNYEGLTVLEAREKLVQWLKENNLFEKEEDIMQNVGTSDRFGDIVEALPKTQWFVNVNKIIPGRNKSLKDLMREAVTTGHRNNPEQKVKITPERFERIYLNWIDNLRDWCVSRQIWWGHRIPVWYPNSKFQNKENKIYVGVNPPSDLENWEQDSDTLDTWFSSGLWTFSTLGWPNETVDLKTFHPTSWMQMGYEILPFWMARMILMSTYLVDEIPFRDVYFHGILRDETGKKFSKSAGNSVDPLEIIEKYGTDALRFSLISGITPGNDARFYEEKIEGARNLVNKIWNISRYIIGNYQLPITNYQLDNNLILSLADNWILDKLQNLKFEIKFDLEHYQFSQASEKLRAFTWDDFADWYLEVCKFEKSENKDKILGEILITILKLWHPFIPFVTETIWTEMGMEKMLIFEKWPSYTLDLFGGNQPVKDVDKLMGVKSSPDSLEFKNEFEIIKNIITSIRNARSEHKIEPTRKVKAVIYAGEKKELIESQAELIKNLRTGIGELEIKEKGEKIENAIYIATEKIEIYLIGALDEAKEKQRIEKEIENLEKLIKSGEGKLKNKEFIAKAPEAIVNKEKEKLENWENELQKLKEQVKNLK